MGFLSGPREKRNVFPEPPIPPFLGADPSGSTSAASNPDGALAVPVVWACVNLLANTVSTLPLDLFRTTGGSEVPSKVTAPKLLVSPFPGVTQSEWVHQMMVSLLLRGNYYGRITDTDVATGFPTQIQSLSPDRVRVTTDGDGMLSYKLLAASGSVWVDVPAEQIFHVRGMTLPGGVVGLSPIQYAAATIGLDISSRKFAGDFFEGGAVPKAVLTGEQRLTQEQSRTLKDRLLASLHNREPIVLGAGVSYTPIQVRPEESQFLLTQQANVSQIARYFSVPAEMVGGASTGSNITYANLGERNIHFLQFCLNFWLKRIEDAFFPLFPRSQYVKFRVEELLRVDPHTRAEVDVLMVAGKIRTPSEIRATYGAPPMTPDQLKEADMVPLKVGPMGRPAAAPAVQPPADEQAPPAPPATQGVSHV